MKRIVFLLLVIISAMSSYAANVEKQYKKLIENFDVADEAKYGDTLDAAGFWNAMLDNNELRIKFLKDLKKNKGAEKEALTKTAQLPRFYPQYDETIDHSMQGFCDTLLMDMGISELGFKCSLHVVYSDDANAFTALTEDGFAICLTKALISKKGITYDILKGYVANEFAHGALLHHERLFYAGAKKRRKDNITEGIAAGVCLFFAALAAAEDDNTTCGNDCGTTVENNIEINVSPVKYIFQYSKEQVFEADLVAYRFLEHLGKGEAFINGLRILGTPYDALYEEDNDHPTIVDRIGFLKYVQQHPELGNTKNIKLWRKRIQSGSGVW